MSVTVKNYTGQRVYYLVLYAANHIRGYLDCETSLVYGQDGTPGTPDIIVATEDQELFYYLAGDATQPGAIINLANISGPVDCSGQAVSDLTNVIALTPVPNEFKETVKRVVNSGGIPTYFWLIIVFLVLVVIVFVVYVIVRSRHGLV